MKQLKLAFFSMPTVYLFTACSSNDGNNSSAESNKYFTICYM